MPEPETIVMELTRIARSEIPLAVAWHLIIALSVLRLTLGARPSSRRAAAWCALPLISVAGLAAAYANPFNAILCGLGALGALLIAYRLSDQPLVLARWPIGACGALLIAFAWLYPHFLEDRSPLSYLYAAPTGLLPCPSLALIIGASLLTQGFGSKSWSVLFGVLGLFYGLFGALRLGVYLDLVLAAGALTLVGVGLRLAPHTHETPSERPDGVQVSR